MKKRKKRVSTIFSRLFLPLFLVMLLQSGTFYLVTVYGTSVRSLNQNAIDILTERVESRKNEWNTLVSSRWGQMTLYSEAICRLYDADYAQSLSAPLYADNDQKRAFLRDASETLFKMLRNNAVNGVFLILTNQENATLSAADTESFYGLCIRDYDATSGYTDKEDLLLIRAPSLVANALGCSKDSYWEALYTFGGSDSTTGDFFYEPLKEAYANPGVAADNFKYFSSPHTYGDSDREVVSYSMPLIGSDGRIFGVIGVELLTSYLPSLMPEEELQANGNGAYLLVEYTQGSNDYQVIAAGGTTATVWFGNAESITLNPADTVENDKNLLAYESRQGEALACLISPLKLYNNNTPFENQKVALIAAVPENELFALGTQVKHSLLHVAGSVLLVGFAAIFAVSYLMVHPIKKLAKEVRHADGKDTKLKPIHILEIDQLLDAIVRQGQTISQSKVRTEFLSRMSHDMRTPMNAIIGFSSPETLENCGKQKLLEYLAKINESGQYLLGLINEVLDMTKIDSGKMELQSTVFSLSEVWNVVLPMVSAFADHKDVTFEKELPQNKGKSVIGDPQRLCQIVVNLLSNAIKFTPKGGKVTLAVTEDSLAAEGLSLQIKVRDTGIGMSEEFQERLYQPFVQEHSNREGTGLGLSIAHQLVSLMGGTILCQSKQGQGTEFTIHLILPYATEDKPLSLVHPGNAEEIEKILAGKRVLLCEDQPLNQQIVCRLLEKQSVVVDIASDGKAGVAFFTDSPLNTYDAILMDIRMPIMDGLEAARAIRALPREDAQRVPIIATTANAFREDMEASKAAGMNAHLSKPIEPQKLYATLAALIGAKNK